MTVLATLVMSAKAHVCFHVQCPLLLTDLQENWRVSGIFGKLSHIL
jgi:hypothetical protein